MIYGYDVSYCETISKHWTPTAIDCYKIGCNCSKCNLYKIYFSSGESKCMMKYTVFNLVKKLGAPDKEVNINEKIL